MSDRATFTEHDFRELTPHDKKALKAFHRVAIDFEPIANVPGVSQKSMDALIAKSLAVEGPPSIYGRTFKITDKGSLAVEWLHGRRTRIAP